MKLFASVALATGIGAYGAAMAAPVVQPLRHTVVQRSGLTFHMAACSNAGAVSNCHVHIVTDSAGNPRSVPFVPPGGLFNCQKTVPSGCLSPAQLRSAYNITGAGRSTTTVAIVDAFAYPQAEADLAAYRAQFLLPPCTVASGCLRIVNQTGGTTPPPVVDFGWDVEQGLDLAMVSAMCPNCRIILVQTNDNFTSNLAAGVNEAVVLGAHVVSNSYGGGELGSQSFEWEFNHPGVAITASTGDSGFGAQFPATSPHVTAVGGTTLNMNLNSRLGETVWGGAGSGCSSAYQEPAWQTSSHANMANNTLCTMRAEADVSAVADPNTGVLVHYSMTGLTPGFYIVGGTSVAAPLIGGIYGERDDVVFYGRNPYNASSSAFHDVTSGTNAPGIGGSCGGTYLCVGEVGYDGPTGLGSPNGDTAF
jgi:hypothetical protein